MKRIHKEGDGGGSAVGECLSITDVLGPLICLQAREGDKKNNNKKKIPRAVIQKIKMKLC